MDKETKNYLEKKFGAIDKKFGTVNKKLDAIDTKFDKKLDDLNARTARGFTEMQTQINTIQRQLTDADLPQIKRDNKAIKQAVGIGA